jgi:hypothetical protein
LRSQLLLLLRLSRLSASDGLDVGGERHRDFGRWDTALLPGQSLLLEKLLLHSLLDSHQLVLFQLDPL